jgi:hypothetical protein
MLSRLVIVASALGLVAGQEMTSVGGDILMRTTRQVSINALQSTVARILQDNAAMSTAMSGMAASMEDGLGAAMVNVQAAATARAIGNEGRIASLETSMDSVTASVSNSVASLTASVNVQLNAAASDAASQARVAAATLSQSLVDIDATVSTAMGAMDARITASVSRAAVAQVSSAAAMTSALSRAAAAQAVSVANITAAVAGKADAQPKIWAGGCTRHGNSGWHYYCLNRELYNTAGGYLRKASDTRFAASRAGFFRINFWTIKSASGWSHNNVYVQGGLQYHSYMHTAGCWWQDDTIDHTFRVANGWWWSVRLYSNCSHAFHAGGAESGGSAYHSRIQSTYVGPIE